MTSWSLLTDNGFPPVQGSVTALRSVAKAMQKQAENAEEAHTVLQKVQREGIGHMWCGPAADTWTDQLAKCPKGLKRVTEGYGDAAHAVSVYADRVEVLKEKASGLLSDVVAIRKTIASLESRQTVEEAEVRRLARVKQDLAVTGSPAEVQTIEAQLFKADMRRRATYQQIQTERKAIASKRTSAEKLRGDQAAAAKLLSEKLAEASARAVPSGGFLGWMRDRVKDGFGWIRDITGSVMPVLIGAAALAGVVGLLAVGGPASALVLGKVALASKSLHLVHLTHLVSKGAHEFMESGKISPGLLVEAVISKVTHGIGKYALVQAAGIKAAGVNHAMSMGAGTVARSQAIAHYTRTITQYESSVLVAHSVSSLTSVGTHAVTDSARRLAPSLWEANALSVLRSVPLTSLRAVSVPLGSRP